jgi:hypothetical protein
MKARLHSFLPEYGDEQRRRLGYSLEEVLIECFYNNHVCDHRNFVWSYSIDYGNCYQFNTGIDPETGEHNSVPIEKSLIAGPQNGLQLIFFLGESKNRFTNVWSMGLKFFVHSQSAKPSKFESIIVKTATRSNIGLSRSFESKLPQPYSGCTDLKGELTFFYLIKYFSRSKMFLC